MIQATFLALSRRKQENLFSPFYIGRTARKIPVSRLLAALKTMHFRCLKKCKIQQNYNYKHQSCNICNEGSKTDGFVPPSLQVILLQKIKLWCMLCSYKTTDRFGYLRTGEDRGKKHFRFHFESLEWFTWKSSYIWWYWNLKARRTEHEWGEIQYGA